MHTVINIRGTYIQGRVLTQTLFEHKNFQHIILIFLATYDIVYYTQYRDICWIVGSCYLHLQGLKLCYMHTACAFDKVDCILVKLLYYVAIDLDCIV